VWDVTPLVATEAQGITLLDIPRLFDKEKDS
jgi:hypothetical protein